MYLSLADVIRGYKGRVKEAIHIRLHPNNINRDSGIEIPEAWIPTIKKHKTGEWYNSGQLREQLLAGIMEQQEDRNAPITADLCDINDTVQSVDLIT